MVLNNVVWKNNIEEVQNFLSKDSNLNYYQNNLFLNKCTALHVACDNGFLKIIKLLVNDKIINLNIENR